MSALRKRQIKEKVKQEDPKEDEQGFESSDNEDFVDEASPAESAGEEAAYEEKPAVSRKTKKRMRGGREKDREGKKRRKNEGAYKFIEDEAKEDSDEEYEKLNRHEKENVRYRDDELERKANPNFSLKNLEEKYQRMAQRELARERGEVISEGADEGDYSEEEDEDAIGAGDDEVTKQGLLPSVEDPKLWQVRVMKNFERIGCMALLNKSIDFAQKGKPLSILSATSSDSTEGYIFVEAFKEIHIKQAMKGFSFYLNKMLLVPTEEMPVVYLNDQAKNNELHRNQWVRIKNGTCYNGDIGLVEKVDDSKVYVRLIPRIDLTSSGNKKIQEKKFLRIPQRINFHPTPAMGAYPMTNKHHVLDKYFTVYKNQLYSKGFLFKHFPFKQLDASTGVKPTHEEIQNFQQTLQKSGSSGSQMHDYASDDDLNVEEAIKQSLLQGGATVYAKGDKITVNRGDLKGLKGAVVAIEEGGQVTFRPMGIPGLSKALQIDISLVSKYFEPGDLVRVTEAKYKGETGQVIDVEGNKISLVLDQSQQEISILANYLKLKSDTDHPLTSNMVSAGARANFSAMDLVSYDGLKKAGLVLQVHEDYLKVINEQGKLTNLKIADVGKKLPNFRRGATLGGRDSNGNTLALEGMVKCIKGQHKGITGPIRHAFKNYLFLWNKDFVQSNGIFVENCTNVEILGAQFMKGSQGQAIASQNRMVKDPLVGKLVVIVGGEFKGHRGRVSYANDVQALVELTSKCKKIPIDKSLVKEVNPEEGGNGRGAGEGGRSVHGGASAYGGATVYDGGKTPMALHTPSYYPQSQWGGGNDYENDNANNQDAFIQRPGSEHQFNQANSQAGQQQASYQAPVQDSWAVKKE